MAHLGKARGFDRERNRLQTLRHADLALTKLKQLKDHSLEFIIILDDAMAAKYNALHFMCRDKEALECATERYNMWATTNIRNPRTIGASFPLIESLIRNEEFAQAQLIARTVYEMTMHPMSHEIPEDKQQQYLASAASYLADATHALAQSGGIPPEGKQKAGEESIALARKALEIHTQLFGAESGKVVTTLGTLADLLIYFNDDNDDEAIRLLEQVIAIGSRVSAGSTILNVAVVNHRLGSVYGERADRAEATGDLDRSLVNLELAQSYLREAARIYRENNLMNRADHSAQQTKENEEKMLQLRIRIAAKAAVASWR